MSLRIIAPALEIPFGMKAGAQHRDKSPAVEPLVALESDLGQTFHFPQGGFQQPAVSEVNLWIIFPEEGIIFPQAERTGALRKKLVGFVKKLLCEGVKSGCNSIHDRRQYCFFVKPAGIPVEITLMRQDVYLPLAKQVFHLTAYCKQA